MYRKLKNEDLAISMLAKDMKTFGLYDITRISDRIAKIYGEPIREKLVAQLFTNLTHTA